MSNNIIRRDGAHSRNGGTGVRQLGDERTSMSADTQPRATAHAWPFVSHSEGRQVRLHGRTCAKGSRDTLAPCNHQSPPRDKR